MVGYSDSKRVVLAKCVDSQDLTKKTMIIHNTTYSILPEIENRWVKWMQREHIPQIKTLPGVVNCRFLKLMTEIEGDEVTYALQTEIDNLPASEAFLQEHSPVRQHQMKQLFPGQVLYFETVLKIVSE